MNFVRRILRVRPEPALALIAAILFTAGCGGGSASAPVAAPTPTPAAPVSIQGQWQVVAHSGVNPASSVLVETNFVQTGADVVAGKSSVILIQGSPGAFTALGGECDNGSLGDDSVQATISNQTQLSFTLTEAGSLGTGTSTGTATISSDGTQITSGTYTTPAACGFTADNGSITGTLIKPFSGTYAGTLANGSGSDAVTVTVSQSGYNLTVVGTNNGTSFTLTGTAVGATFHVTGTIGGQSVEDVGIYEPTTNDFRVYDSAFHFLGVLGAQSAPPAPSPVSVTVAPATAFMQPGQGMSFTATVMNDSANKGVTWALSGASCSGAACGSVSSPSSASGAAITYTAPASVPSGAVALTATSVADGTKSAGATITITAAPAIVVVVSPTTASVVPGGATQPFTATLQNDSQNKGVNWTLSLSGGPCTASVCGTVSPTTSVSGASVNYTAPATAPAGPITLTATSIADSTKSAAASITVTAPSGKITVTVSPTTASVATGAATQTFTATLQNDTQSKGVNWSLSISGSACAASACGSVSPASTLSGVTATYTSPATTALPASVVLTATSVADNSVSAAATITLTTPSPAGPLNLGAGSAPSTVVDSNGVIDIAWDTQAGIVFSQSQDNGVTFSSPKLVPALPAAAGVSSIQVDGQNDIFILAGYNPTGMVGGNTAILSRSTDGGKTFNSVVVKQNIFQSLLLVHPSGVLDFAYANGGVDPGSTVHESRSTDGGNTFVNDQLLWQAGTSGSNVRKITGAIGPQGQVYLTWDDQVDFDSAVYFIASLDGANFLPYQEIGGNLVMNTEIFNDNPTLVVDALGNVNLAWVNADTKVYFTRSTDQGQTFATPVSLAASSLVDEQNALRFVVRPDGEIDFVFAAIPSGLPAPAPSQLFFNRSLDHGATWSTPVNLSLPNPVQNFMGAQDPYVGVDTNGKITIAWQDDSNGKFSGDNDIYVRTSADGVTFSGPTNVSNTTDQIEVNPIILETPSGRRYMTWYDMNGKQSNPVLSVFFYAVQ